MFPIPSNETLVETKVCKHCGIDFPITDRDMEFYEKVSPTFGGKKYFIPPPKLCPDCRQQRRLSWRNRRKSYRRKCDQTGKNIISMFSPDKPFTVYHSKIWEGDSWDPKTYGREFDFSRPFFEQFQDVLLSTPLPHLAVVESTLENADYVNGANSVKNAYLSDNIVESEDVYYSEDVYFCSNVVDCLDLKNSQECYNCINSININNGEFLFKCNSCANCTYCSFCDGCTNCIGCFNLKNKSYYIFNKPYSPESYKKKQRELLDKKILQEVWKLQEISPKKCVNTIGSERVIGDNIINSYDCQYSFDIVDSRNIRYSSFITEHSTECVDISYWWQEINFCYEGVAIGMSSSKILFSAETYANMQNCFYCYFCYPNGSNLFWCVGLRNASYCILNRQYTKEEYEELVPKIIEHMMTTGEWGEFFPSSLSPFGYNETVANEHFPLTREEVLASSLRGVEWNETTKQSSAPMVSVSRTSGTSGSPHFVRDDETKEDSDTFLHWSIFNWSDYESPFPKGDKIIPARKLPEDISSIPDDILNWAIECEVTGKPFRIIPQELEFYRKHHLPIPRRHPDQRHLDRMKMRNPRKLYERICDQCGKKMITTYAPERPERVYCEVCYEREVVG